MTDPTVRAAGLSDEALAAEQAALEAEATRRATIRDAERRTDDQLLAYLHAAGRENGGPYEPPVGIVGAYPRGWRVTHGTKAYEACQPGVTTPPPGDCWNEVSPDSELIPFWQPGPHPKGTRVRDAGHVWTALADVDGPRPSEYPGGWDQAD